MALERDLLNENKLPRQFETSENAQPAQDTKKDFVEPTISVPADVLEATAFFQIPTLDTSDT